MNILRPIDIEDEIRQGLSQYMTVYCRTLPAQYTTPCLTITATGGSTANTIDTFTVVLDARAETDAEAFAIIRTAQGLLESLACSQFGALRSVVINSLANWGNDPARPDLKLCSLTALVTAHREEITIT